MICHNELTVMAFLATSNLTRPEGTFDIKKISNNSVYRKHVRNVNFKHCYNRDYDKEEQLPQVIYNSDIFMSLF